MPVEDVTRSWDDNLLSPMDLLHYMTRLSPTDSERDKVSKHIEALANLLIESEDREKRARAEAFEEAARIVETAGSLMPGATMLDIGAAIRAAAESD